MTQQKTICVYCGASPRVDEKYKTAAYQTGQALAKAGYRIVYGGGSSGLMGIIANSALDNGGDVIGIIPDHIDEREKKHPNLTELHVVSSMHERKAMMANYSDIFLILPGGLGTMDEFFEIVTWRQLGLHDKTIIVYNMEKYWENLKLLLQNIESENFMKPQDTKLYHLCDDLKKVLEEIDKAPFSIKDVKDSVV